jgi:hypothetical protein
MSICLSSLFALSHSQRHICCAGNGKSDKFVESVPINDMIRIWGKIDWFKGTRLFGLTLLWSGLLLSALLLFSFSTATPNVSGSTDVTSTVAFGAASYTVNEGDGSALIMLTITPPSSTTVTAIVSSANLQAHAPDDFAALRQSLAISPGVESVTLPIAIHDDLSIEGNEQFQVTLSNLQGATLGVITETVVTIEDNDAALLTVSDVTVTEGDGSVSLLITQSGVSTLDSVVNFHTVPGSATSPNDYVESNGTAIIPAGSTQTEIMLMLTADEEVELAENFSLQLTDPLNAELANATAIVTILDDDGLPQLDLRAATADEADGILSFVATLSMPWPQPVMASYTTLDGTAISPDDYIASTGTVVIPPGSVSATVEVSIVADQVAEPDEEMFLALSTPGQAILGVNQAKGTIRGDYATLYLPKLHR